MDEASVERSSLFPLTSWTLLRRVASGDAADRSLALDRICSLYWFPVYACIRAQGHSSHDAEDLTQGFFVHLLQQDPFDGMAPEKGRLRAYLLTCLKRFLVDQHRRETRLKRGGGQRPVAIDARRADQLACELETLGALAPDQVFERLWATTLLENVYRRLEARYAQRGQAVLFERLSPFFRTTEAEVGYRELAEELGMSPGAVRVTLHRMRQRYRATLGEMVAETLAPGDDSEEELRYLRSLLG